MLKMTDYMMNQYNRLKMKWAAFSKTKLSRMMMIAVKMGIVRYIKNRDIEDSQKDRKCR